MYRYSSVFVLKATKINKNKLLRIIAKEENKRIALKSYNQIGLVSIEESIIRI